MTGYAPPKASVPALGGIVEQLARALPVPNAFKGRLATVAVLPSGQLYFDGDYELDTDGWSEGAVRGDVTHRSGTSLVYSDGTPVNANEVPFFVLPKPMAWAEQFGIRLGDLAAVVYREKVAFAVYADRGPQHKLGEGSLQLFRELGQERIKDGRIRDVGMGPGVVTIVFPGSRSSKPPASQTELLARIAKARKLFTNLSGGGVAAARAEEVGKPAAAEVGEAAASGAAAGSAARLFSLADRMVDGAREELGRYGGIAEAVSPLRERVGEYWRAIGNDQRDGASNAPWSAAFVSWVVRRAGAGDAFRYSAGHSRYVHQAIEDRKAGRTSRFWAMRPQDLTILPGDILAMNRGDRRAIEFEEAEASDDFESHCDFVVSVDKGRLATIGGNVADRVGEKVFAWKGGKLCNAANADQQVYAVLRAPAI